MLRAVTLALLGTAVLAQEAPADNAAFDRPEAVLAKQFPEYKFMSGPGAPLRRAVEDWDGARQRVQSDLAMAKWVRDVQGTVTAWMRGRGDNADWVAGWGHDMIDPAKGTPKHWTWTTAEPARASAEDRKLHGAWVFYQRSTNIHNVLNAARLFRLTGNQADFDWATTQLDFYAQNYSKWPVQTRSGRSQMMGQSVDEAPLAIELADAVRLLGPKVEAARRQQWRQGLLLPMLRNLQASKSSSNNIAVWEASASAVLALELGLSDDFNSALKGPRGIEALLRQGVTPDYLWFESSPEYGSFTQQALAGLSTATSLAGQDATVRKAMLLTQDMIVSQASMRFSDGTLPSLGDSVPGIAAFDPHLLNQTQRTMPIRGAKLSPSWATLLDPNMPTGTPPVENDSRNWPWFQAAMLRDSGWELFFHYGQRTPSHAQGDALSYELRYQGTVISAPAGSAAYGSPLFREYLRVSAAHNMPLIEGFGQVRFLPGRLVSTGNDRIEASQPGFPADADVRRSLSVSAKGAFVDTVTKLPGTRPRRLGSIFNTICRVQPQGQLAPADTPQGPGLNWWKNTRASQPATNWSATLNCDGKSFAMTLTANVPGRVYVSSAPDRTGAPTRTAIYFEVPSAVELSTRMQIAPR